MPSTPGRALRKMRQNNAPMREPKFTGACPIRQHTGDGAYIGRCEHATYGGACPLHGRLSDYPNNDDRAIDPRDCVFAPAPRATQES